MNIIPQVRTIWKVGPRVVSWVMDSSFRLTFLTFLRALFKMGRSMFIFLFPVLLSTQVSCDRFTLLSVSFSYSVVYPGHRPVCFGDLADVVQSCVTLQFVDVPHFIQISRKRSRTAPNAWSSRCRPVSVFGCVLYCEGVSSRQIPGNGITGHTRARWVFLGCWRIPPHEARVPFCVPTGNTWKCLVVLFNVCLCVWPGSGGCCLRLVLPGLF